MHHTDLNADDNLKVLARIDSVDNEFVSPFREFLENSGTHVAVNRESTGKLTYYLAIGDYNFVKSKADAIFPKPKQTALIIYGSTPVLVKSLAGKPGIKIVLIDAKIPDSRLIHEIFAFLFTSKYQILDLRSNKKNPDFGIHEDLTNLDFLSGDRERVNESLKSIYAQEKKVPVTKPSDDLAEKLIRKKFPGRKLKVSLVVAIFLLMLPYLCYVLSMTVAAVSLTLAAGEVYHGNLPLAQQINILTKESISQSKLLIPVIGLPLVLTGHEQKVRDQERLLSFLSDVSEGLTDFAALAVRGREMASIMLAATTGANSPAGQKTPALKPARSG